MTMSTLKTTAPPRTVDHALARAVELGSELSSPGAGSTLELWQTLSEIAAADLGAARAIEPHLDALAILREASASDLAAMGAVWGVFASESDIPLIARNHGEWLLTGTKNWCSLASRLDAALITAVQPDGERRLFAIDLTHAGVLVDERSWHARGLSEIPSGPIELDHVPGTPVGDAGWYLNRPGFSWGAIGVAACWHGGAVGIARTVYEATDRHDDIALMQLGAIDEIVQSGRRALEEAATLVDAGEASGKAGSLLAKRVRATVARGAEEIIARAGHALGPAALALDATHAKRIADLNLYVRQHHAERDQAALGRSILELGGAPW